MTRSRTSAKAAGMICSLCGGPRLLDAFACEGAAGFGYMCVGYCVDAIDTDANRLRYYPAGPCPAARRIVGDAVVYLRERGHEYAVRHASPPCQPYSIATAGNKAARGNYDRLIAATRNAMQMHPGPWVIENVEQAAAEMIDPIMLCGRMFGLGAMDADGEPLVLDRHRLFESNVHLVAPPHPAHGAEQVAGVYGGSRRAKRLEGETLAEVAPRDRYAARYERRGGYVPRSKAVKQQLLGVDWMTGKGMGECIPPAYAKHVGLQMLAHVQREAA